MAIIKIQVFVPDLASVLALFDNIEVQRSILGPPNYTDAASLMSDSPTVAALIGSTSQPYAGLQGLQLKIKVNQAAENTVTFTAANPISIQNVINAINAAVPGVLALNNGDGKLRIQTTAVGTGATLEITDGSANAVLGFTSGQKSNGLDEYVELQVDVDTYNYEDKSGLATNYYRTRYLHLATSTYSSWSDWILGSTGAAISSTYLTVGKIKLANLDGTALVGKKVTVVNTYYPVIKDTYFIAGSSKTVETDGLGTAQVSLVKGSTIDVIVEGTSVIRRILVPSNVTEFDLLDPSLQTDDPFGIQVPDLPAAARSS